MCVYLPLFFLKKYFSVTVVTDVLHTILQFLFVCLLYCTDLNLDQCCMYCSLNCPGCVLHNKVELFQLTPTSCLVNEITAHFDWQVSNTITIQGRGALAVLGTITKETRLFHLCAFKMVHTTGRMAQSRENYKTILVSYFMRRDRGQGGGGGVWFWSGSLLFLQPHIPFLQQLHYCEVNSSNNLSTFS